MPVHAECGTVQEQTHMLPARVVIHLLLAAGLFEKVAIWACRGC